MQGGDRENTSLDHWLLKSDRPKEALPLLVDFLSKITPVNMNSFIKEQHKCVVQPCVILVFLWLTCLCDA